MHGIHEHTRCKLKVSFVAEREAQRAEARTKHSGRNLVLALREIDWASRQKRMVSNGNRNFMPVVKDAEGKSWSGILIKLPPGRYVIAGYGAETYMHPSMCFCLGTVMFDAVPGKIVDLGRVYSHAQENGWSLVARPRTIDGLTSGRNLNSLYIAPRATPVVLPRIGGAEVIPAEFQAVGRITNALNSEIDRVTPIQGVIRYEPGKIIDARTNQPVPPLDL